MMLLLLIRSIVIITLLLLLYLINWSRILIVNLFLMFSYSVVCKCFQSYVLPLLPATYEILVLERPVHLYRTVRRGEDQRDTRALVSKRFKLSTLLWGYSSTQRPFVYCLVGRIRNVPQSGRLSLVYGRTVQSVKQQIVHLLWGLTEPLVRVCHCTRKPLNSPSISIVQDKYRMTNATRVCCCCKKRWQSAENLQTHTHYTSTQWSWESTYLHTC